MILYYSGTGNSEYAAKRIGGEIGDEVLNLFEKLRNAGTAGKVAWALGVAGLFIITLSFLVNSSYSPFLYAKF